MNNVLRSALTVLVFSGCATVGPPKYFAFPKTIRVVLPGAVPTRLPEASEPESGVALSTPPLLPAGEGSAASADVAGSAGATSSDGWALPSSAPGSSPVGSAGQVSGTSAAVSCVGGSSAASISGGCFAGGGASSGGEAASCAGPSSGGAASVGVSAGFAASSSLGVCTEFLGVPLQGSTDIVFLLDRSSSMAEAANFEDLSWQPGGQRVDGVAIGVPSAQAGPLLPDKLTVASRELLKVLDHLPDGTRFSIGFFDENLTWFRPGLTALDAATRDDARRFLASVHAEGATAVVPALQAALALNPRRVVLLSDGQPNFEGTTEQLVATARAQIRRGVRFDTVTLGAAVDGTLLAGLAHESGGQARSY